MYDGITYANGMNVTVHDDDGDTAPDWRKWSVLYFNGTWP